MTTKKNAFPRPPRDSGTVTRRSLLAVFIASPLAMTACTGSGSASQSASGTLTVGVATEPTDFSPSRVQTLLFPFTRQLYDSLIEYGDDMKPEPRLATKWVANADKTHLTVTLRDDVHFHSGRAMTAKDVAANLEYFADPKRGQQMYAPMAVVDSWKAVDDKTLDIAFKGPTSDLQMTDLLQSWTIGDPQAFDKVANRGEGTGPFKFVEWVRGQRITLERNNGYWKGAPTYTKVVYRVFSDMDSLVSAFESGQVDVAVDVPALAADRLKATNTVVTGYPGALIEQWRLNPGQAPFDNKNVRMAINYATDRDAISKAVYHSFGKPTALPYSTSSPAYDETLAGTLAYDLDKARTLLQSSGLSPDQLAATISVSSSAPNQQQAAQILQASLAKINFALKIQLLDSTEWANKQLAGQFQMMDAAIGNAQKYPTRIATNSIYRIANNPVGATKIFSDYKPAVDAANAAVTKEQQAAAFAQLNKVLVDSMWAVSIGYQPTLWLVNPHTTGVARNIDNMLLLGSATPKK